MFVSVEIISRKKLQLEGSLSSSTKWQSSSCLKISEDGDRFVIDRSANILLQSDKVSSDMIHTSREFNALHPGDTLLSIDGGSEGHCALRNGQFATNALKVGSSWLSPFLHRPLFCI